MKLTHKTMPALGEEHATESRGVEPRWDMSDDTVSCNGWVCHGAIKVSPRPDINIDAGRVVRLYMTLWGAVMSMGSYQNG